LLVQVRLVAHASVAVAPPLDETQEEYSAVLPDPLHSTLMEDGFWVMVGPLLSMTLNLAEVLAA